MKRSYIRKWLTVCICLVLYSSIRQQASAQSIARDFHARQYQEAIENIANGSNGELTPAAIRAMLSNIPQSKFGGQVIRSTDDGEYITVDPVIDVVSFDGEEDAIYTVNGFPAESTLTIISVTFSLPAPDWIDGDPIINEDANTITIDLLPNDNANARSTGIIINAQVGGFAVPSVAAYVIQEGEPEPFILVSPEIQSISYEGGVTDQFDIIHYNIADWMVDATTLPSDGWITIGENNHTGPDQYIKFNIALNSTGTYRQGNIKIKATDDLTVFDELTIVQGALAEPSILITPEIQTLSYEAQTTAQFNVINFNITGWELAPGTLPSWITVQTADHDADTITFSVQLNEGDTYRQDTIIIRELAIPGVSDTLKIIQGAESPQPYLFIDPEIRSITYVGGVTGEFDIINFNIEDWEVVESTLPGWIPGFSADHDSDIITFNVDTNTTDTYRTDIIKIQEIGDTTVFDELTIVQGALSESVILITPEIQSFNYDAQTTDPFNILNFNITDWEPAPGTLPAWISVDTADHTANTITFSILLNEGDNFRMDTIVIREMGNPSVSDVLTIYQGSLSDTSILVTPEVQSVPYSGGETDPFQIIHFNIGEWEVDTTTMPDWIHIDDTLHSDDHTGNYITFSIDTNGLDVYRVDTVVIRETGNPAVFDILTIYQGALSESVILITPEIQSVTYEAQTTDTFNIIHFNIENWEVDPATIPDWISIADSSQSDDHTGNYITFSIETNELDVYRVDTVIIRETGNPAVSDILTIYQGALSDTSILVTPEIQSFPYSGGLTEQFQIIHFNIGEWELDPVTLPDWMSVTDSVQNDGHTGNYITFNLDTNELDVYRVDTVIIRETGNPAVSDSLVIYQGALSQSVILVTPEIQVMDYEAQTTVQFDVIHFNIENWEVVAGTVPDWVASYSENHENDYVTFDIEINEDETYREHTVTIQEVGNPGVFDQLKIIQGALSVSSILITPEVQGITYEAQTTGEFDIIHFNIDGWEVVESTIPDWVASYYDDHVEDFVTFDVELNEDDTYREHTVTIQEEGNPGVIDQLRIVQGALAVSTLLIYPEIKSLTL